MSLLAVSVQFYGRPRIVARIPASAFYPPPKVDSAVVRIDVRDEPAVSLGEVARSETGRSVGAQGRAWPISFAWSGRALAKSARRCAMPSAPAGLAPAAVEQALTQAGIDPRRRAETLSLQEWAELGKSIHLLESARK